MTTNPTIKRALISVSNKQGIVGFAKQLNSFGVEIIATGGTAQLLNQNNIPIIEIADYTGFPEIMNGRVKTLHPKIHGGILARRGTDDHTLNNHQIPTIDLVVVNLYPFQETIAKPNCQFTDAIEQIDIGGPTMLRAAAKNHQFVSVVVDPTDYDTIIDEIKTSGGTSSATRQRLATKTFQHTAQYDTAIAQYFTEHTETPATTQSIFAPQLSLHLNKQYDLRYGENPHQQASFYTQQNIPAGSLAAAKLLQGKPLSYNNLIDADAALSCAQSFDHSSTACVIVKHATPCGVALGDTLIDAYEKALQTDAVSAFGGIIALNQTLDEKTADHIIQKQFVEVLLAPDFTEGAIKVLANKPNLRALAFGKSISKELPLCYQSVSGGILVQQQDLHVVSQQDLTVVTQRQPTSQELQDLMFAWKVVKFIKSNAIVYAKNKATYGIGTGQTSRVFSAKIAALKADEANLSLQGAVMASDAFFPFPDGVMVAAEAGITAVIQPGGSKRDAEVIKAADEANLAMVMTGVRHFRH